MNIIDNIHPIPLGTYDAFRDVIAWDDDTSKQWVDALNLRAASRDQITLRAYLVELAQLGPGDTVVEVGCGTGALLCDLAGTVSPAGRVIGIEPQPALAKAAIQRLSEAGLGSVGEVRCESVLQSSVECESAIACLAQTVLIHLPDEVLQHCLREMIRVVRRGGRVMSVDQDGDTWIIDHPDREMTRRIVRFNSDQRYADGWTGRRMRRFFRQSGLIQVEIHVGTHVDTDSESYLFGMSKRIAGAAAEVGIITTSECDKWVQQLQEVASDGNFFSSINNYACVGIRPNRCTGSLINQAPEE